MVVATHGSSIWILDDLTPLHQLYDLLRRRARAGGAGPPIPAAADGAPADQRRLRRRGGAGDRRPRAGVAGHGQLRADRRRPLPRAPGQAARRRPRRDLSRRRTEPAERRHDPLPPRLGAGRGRDAHACSTRRAACSARSRARRTASPREPGLNRFLWSLRLPGVAEPSRPPTSSPGTAPRAAGSPGALWRAARGGRPPADADVRAPARPAHRRRRPGPRRAVHVPRRHPRPARDGQQDDRRDRRRAGVPGARPAPGLPAAARRARGAPRRADRRQLPGRAALAERPAREAQRALRHGGQRRLRAVTPVARGLRRALGPARRAPRRWQAARGKVRRSGPAQVARSDSQNISSTDSRRGARLWRHV